MISKLFTVRRMKMKADTVIRTEGMKVLIEKLGLLKAEKFT